MSDRKIKTRIKMLIKAGDAKPAPPVGSTLGPYGLNLVQFCKEFNDKTAGMTGMVPALITIFEDRTYEFELKTPPVAELLKQKLSISAGAANPLKNTVATISMDQVKEIAEAKLTDLNCVNVESAVKQVLGTCKSMGIKLAN